MKRITLLAITTASASALALPALAGNLQAPKPEPQVAAPAPVAVAPMMTSDWSGGYVGLGFGYNKAKTSPDVGSGASGIGGVYGGYNYQFGKWVVGGEVGVNKMHSGYGADTLKTTYDAKLRGGYDLGSSMVYGTVGASHSEHVHGVGKLIGVGMDYKLNEHMIVGAEADYTLYNNGVAPGTDLKDTSLMARVTFKF